jgi:hypothetical protein
VTFTAAQVGGASGTVDSIGIQLTFSEAVTDLTADKITIANGSGSAEKGNLSGSGAEWTISLASVTTEGDVTVSVANWDNFEVTNSPQSVTVYKDTSETDIDPDNNITIGGTPADLGRDGSGPGWRWNAADKELTLVGGDVGAINIVTDADFKIVLADDASASNITNSGTGTMTITGDPDKKLTLISENGPAISAKGDIVIESGKIYALTTDAAAAAIESLTGSVVITGGADVEADSRAGGSAIKAADAIEISTTGTVTAGANGAGYALDAGNTITISGGTVELWAEEDRAFSVTPVVSGENTLVSVNGRPYYGNKNGGGCSGVGAPGLLALALAWFAGKRRN